MKKATLVIKGDLISLGRIAPAREGGATLFVMSPRKL
jgi:hypothetical protein